MKEKNAAITIAVVSAAGTLYVNWKLNHTLRQLDVFTKGLQAAVEEDRQARFDASFDNIMRHYER